MSLSLTAAQPQEFLTAKSAKSRKVFSFPHLKTLRDFARLCGSCFFIARGAMLLLLFTSPAHAADSYSINAGATQTITEHSVCHVVTNGLSSGLFVPTKTATEWTSFRTNAPPGVTSVACDTTPNAFDFTPNVTGAALSTLTTAANTITIAGINAATPVSVSGTGAQISINGGAWVTSGTITNGQTLRVRLTSSASFSTAITATVNVGGVSDSWSVTTRAAAGCSSATMKWTNASSGPCQAASGAMTHGQTKSVTNTASGYTGTRSLTCTDGAISQSGGSCAASGGTWQAAGPCRTSEYPDGMAYCSEFPACPSSPGGKPCSSGTCRSGEVMLNNPPALWLRTYVCQ